MVLSEYIIVNGEKPTERNVLLVVSFLAGFRFPH